MALADIYGMIPDNRTDLIDEMAALWKEAIDGMLRWQEKDSGLFYQLPALPNEKRNYLETSGSLMVAYSLLKGARLDVLTEPEYRAAGEKSWLVSNYENLRFMTVRWSCTVFAKGPALDRRVICAVMVQLIIICLRMLYTMNKRCGRLYDGLRGIFTGKTGWRAY